MHTHTAMHQNSPALQIKQKKHQNAQEFVRWIFAEDKSVSDGMSGFTLRVRGCSRTAFNGDYEPTGDFYFHRPVFYCPATDLVLFYHGERKQWQIYWKTGWKASARLKTHRAVHMPQDGQVWSVFKRSQKKKKKTFVKDSSIRLSSGSTHVGVVNSCHVMSCPLFQKRLLYPVLSSKTNLSIGPSAGNVFRISAFPCASLLYSPVGGIPAHFGFSSEEPGMVCRLATPAELVEAAPDGFTWHPSIATTHGPRSAVQQSDGSLVLCCCGV